MKRYPFSKKAVSLMIATALVATPFASLADTPLGASQVSAQVPGLSEEVNDYITKLVGIYNTLGNDKQIVKDARMEIAQFNNWSEVTVTTPNLKKLVDFKLEQESVNKTFEHILGELAIVLGSENEDDLKVNISDYIASFDTVFGQGAFDDMVDLINVIEAKIVANQTIINNIYNNIDTVDNDLMKLIVNLSGIKSDQKYFTFQSRFTNLVGGYNEVNTGDDAITSYNLDSLIDDVFKMKVKMDTLVSSDLDSVTSNVVSATLKYYGKTPTTPGGPGGVVPAPEVPEGVVDTEDAVSTETKADGRVVTTVDTSKLQEALNAADKVERVSIKLDAAAGDKVEAALSTEALDMIKTKNPEAKVDVETAAGTLSLPVNEIDLEAAKTELNLGASDVVRVVVSLNKTQDTANVVDENNLNTVSDVVEFEITLQVNDKVVQTIKQFTQPITRTIVGSKDFDPAKTVIVRLNADGTFTAVPTKVEGNKASFTSFNNSKYVVIENAVTFPDVAKTDWAKDHIDKLASKFIFKGYDNGKFGPRDNTSRAQLAVLLTRSLGLTTDTEYDGQFKDVTGNEYFLDNNELMAAVEYGIVKGTDTGEFKPYENVSRQAAAAMINRAMELIGADYEKDTKKSYTDFPDAKNVGTWARTDVTSVVQTGIMEGRLTDGEVRFNPSANATRAEVAAMLDRFLTKSDFLN